MGGTAGQKGLPGFGTKGAVTGLNAAQQFPAMQATPALQATRPMSPTPVMPALGGFALGNQRTTTLVPGAPRLPNNPYANAAWRRQTLDQRGSAPKSPRSASELHDSNPFCR
jgi:hypothetical protein